MRRIACALLSLGLALAVLGACKSIPPPTPLSQLNPQQTRGYYVFHQVCAGCHADRTNQLISGPALRGIFKKQYLNSGAPATDDRVMSVILYGYGVMPAVGRAIPAQDRVDLLAYLHTL